MRRAFKTATISLYRSPARLQSCGCSSADLSTLRQTLEGRFERPSLTAWPALGITASSYVLLERRAFADPDPAELGGVVDSLAWSVAPGAQAIAQLAVGSHQSWNFSPEVHFERFVDENRVDPSAATRANRVQGAASLC